MVGRGMTIAEEADINNRVKYLIFIAMIVLTWIIPSPHYDQATSLADLYNQGLSEIFTGLVGLIGWIGLIGVFGQQEYRKRNRFTYCSSCGKKAQSESDLFCRSCGTELVDKQTGLKKKDAQRPAP